MKSELKIIIFRYKQSLYPYGHPVDKGWSLNDRNNSLDDYTVLDGNNLVFQCKCQTVSNTEGCVPAADYFDTLAPCEFNLKLFVDTRRFNCEVHGITDAKTLKGEIIDKQSVTETSKDRWLQHDTQKLKPYQAGVETRVAWSSGCIILPMRKHALVNEIFKQYGYQSGDSIKCRLVEEV